MHKYQNLCKGAIVILSWSGFSALATVYGSDGSSTNIQSIHDTLAQNGDTITLPAGTILQQGRPVLSEIIPDDRLAPWQGNVGVPGGIPTRTAIFMTISPSGGDDSAAINAALNSCPAGQVVKLSPGSFRLDGPIATWNKSNYTLRGSGQGVTILKPTGGVNAVYLRGNLPWPPSTTWYPITSGATKGSNTITVSDTSAFAVNMPMAIGPNPIATWAHNLGFLGNPVPDTLQTLGITFKVRSKTATTVTFDPPCPFDWSGYNEWRCP